MVLKKYMFLLALTIPVVVHGKTFTCKDAISGDPLGDGYFHNFSYLEDDQGQPVTAAIYYCREGRACLPDGKDWKTVAKIAGMPDSIAIRMSPFQGQPWDRIAHFHLKESRLYILKNSSAGRETVFQCQPY